MIVLWRLATGNSYRSVSKTFAVGKSTAVSITKSFCAEISRLSKYFIKFPRTPSRTAKAIVTFKETTNCKILQAIGTIDVVHIAILSTHTGSKVDYYNRRQVYLINSQAVVRGNLFVFFIFALVFPEVFMISEYCITQQFMLKLGVPKF